MSAAFAVFSVANSSDTFILIRAKDLGYSTVGAILAYGLYNVAYMLFSYPAGRISDRIGRWPVIACGWWLYAAVYAGLAFLGGSLFPGLLVAYGIYIGLTKAVGTALVADHAPENAKGTAMGVFNMIAGVATIFGNVVAGELWDHYGSATMFLTGAAIAAVAALSIPILKRI
ncbi:MAG: MFS transporter [Fimbriimonadales bacterium]